jgi:hypothetical protein
MRKPLTAALVLAVLLTSCWDFTRKPYNPKKVLGYKPVYTNDASLVMVETLTPQPVRNAGKIYVKGSLIFQNDLGYGIHVIDNSNPATANRIGFIRVVGNSEMSIKGNYLYVNSFGDLVVVDISDWHHVNEVKRMPAAFSQGYTNFIPLPEHKVYYECPDFFNNKYQIGWVKDSVYNYSCYNK